MDALTYHCCLWLCGKETSYLQLTRTLTRPETSSPAPAKVYQQPTHEPFLSSGNKGNLVPPTPETTAPDTLSWWQIPASGVDNSAMVGFDLLCVHTFNSWIVGVSNHHSWRWVGTCVSHFGVCLRADSHTRLPPKPFMYRLFSPQTRSSRGSTDLPGVMTLQERICVA